VTGGGLDLGDHHIKPVAEFDAVGRRDKRSYRDLA